MTRVGHLFAALGVAASLAAAPAAAADARAGDGRAGEAKAKPARSEARPPVTTRALGSFTPSAADNGGAAARAGAAPELRSFRFTPSGQVNPSRSLNVGTRSRALTAPDSRRGADESAGYDVGIAVGTRGFAVTGTSSKVDIGIASRESLGVGLGYGRKDWTAKLSLAEEAENLRGPDSLGVERRYSIELGGAYLLTPNVQLGAGVRYRAAPESNAEARARAAEDRAAYLGLGIAF